MHVAACGIVHVPAVVPGAVGTHFAGERHGGPTLGSALHAAPSVAGAAHVPVLSVGVAFTQRPPSPHSATAVTGAPMTPHVAPAATSWIVWQVPTPLPTAVGMHVSPRFGSHPAAVPNERSHAAPTVEPDF